ncbi:MAG: transcriptional regulator [Oceanococcaceae bacterium]
MTEALAHAEGRKVRVRAHEIDVRPDTIRTARQRLWLSQDRFTQAFGVSTPTLRKWAQGQREPNGAAKTLLRIIEREPKAVLRALEVP